MGPVAHDSICISGSTLLLICIVPRDLPDNSWTLAILNFFNCDRVNGNSYLHLYCPRQPSRFTIVLHILLNMHADCRYPSVSCKDDSEYLRLRPLFVVLAALLVAGMPVGLLAGLVWAKWRGKLIDTAQLAQRKAAAGAGFAIERHVRRYGVLYEIYSPTMFFWEVSSQLRLCSVCAPVASSACTARR